MRSYDETIERLNRNMQPGGRWRGYRVGVLIVAVGVLVGLVLR